MSKCFRMGKKCKCFNSLNREVEFLPQIPLIYIRIVKRYLRKLINETIKHNNANIFNFSYNANVVKRKSVRDAVSAHKKTLHFFQMTCFLEQKENKENTKFRSYVNNQHEKCSDYLSETVPWELDEFLPIMIFQMMLYSHYHTLNLFESFVIKNN